MRKPWPRSPQYLISDDGVVYGKRTGKPMALGFDQGYPAVSLRVNGGYVRRRVHKLVMEAFVGPCPDGMEVLHGNGIRTDNRLSNLRYGTRSENNRDAIEHGTHPIAARTHCSQGHVFSAENTHMAPATASRGSFRICRTCRRLSQIKYRAKKRMQEGAVTR